MNYAMRSIKSGSLAENLVVIKANIKTIRINYSWNSVTSIVFTQIMSYLLLKILQLASVHSTIMEPIND